MILSGVGATIVSALAVQRELAAGDLVRVPIVGLNLRPQLSLVRRMDKHLSRNASAPCARRSCTALTAPLKSNRTAMMTASTNLPSTSSSTIVGSGSGFVWLTICNHQPREEAKQRPASRYAVLQRLYLSIYSVCLATSSAWDAASSCPSAALDGRTMRSGILVASSTRSATLPNAQRCNPPRPCDARAINAISSPSSAS
jgi:hypothetical protein